MIFSERQLERRIERRLVSRQRVSHLLNFIFCAALLILGILLIISLVKNWFV